MEVRGGEGRVADEGRRAARTCTRTRNPSFSDSTAIDNRLTRTYHAHKPGRALRLSVESAEASSRASSPAPVSAKGVPSLPTIVGSPNVDVARKKGPRRAPAERSDPGGGESQRNATLNAPVKTKRAVHKRTLELETDHGEEAVVGGGPKGKGGPKGGAVAPIKRDQVSTVTSK